MELRKLEQELFAVAASVNGAIKRTDRRLLDIMVSGDMTAIPICLEVLTGRHVKRDELKSMVARVLDSESRQISLPHQELLALKAELEEHEAQYEVTHAALDEIDCKYFKYNIPKPGSEPLDSYLVRVRDFMRRVWREKAEISRRKECKCLLEWMAEIDRSGDGERRVASGELRRVLVDNGVEISGFLIEYLWTVSDFILAEEMDEWFVEVKAVIGNLGVEEDSVIIKCFVAVVEFFEETVGNAKSVGTKRKEDGNDVKQADKRAELFRMIAVEILRLEVAFRSPDLPMLLLSSTYITMVHHLRQKVFKDKFAAIWAKIGEMMPESTVSLFEETLNSGVNEVWKELDNLNAK